MNPLDYLLFYNTTNKCFFFVVISGTSSRSFFKGIQMWKQETILKVGFFAINFTILNLPIHLS